MYLRNQNELELRRFLVVSSYKNQTHHFIDSSVGPFPAITIEEYVIVIIILS